MIRREHRLADGRRLSWQETGNGPPLALLHGWSLSGAAFAELAGPLDAFRLLLPDLPGHGRSSPPAAVSLPFLANDVGAWLAAVAPGPLLLGGWSLGGMVALELAASRQLSVERLLLLATTPRFTMTAGWPHGLPAGQVRALRRSLEQRFEATLGDFFGLTFAAEEADDDRLQVIRAAAVLPGGLPDKIVAAACLDLLAGQDQRALLPAVTCPTRVLHGTHDRVTPVEAGRALAAALPQGSLQEIVGAGHAPHWTRPLEVARAVREFCAWDR